MKLSIHPDALNSFNKRATDLLPKIIRRPITTRVQPEGTFVPDHHISGTITDEEILEFYRVGRDVSGMTVSKFLILQDEEIGLETVEYRTLRLLAEDVQKRRELRGYVSIDWVETAIFKWAIDQHREQTQVPLFDYLLPLLESSIVQRYVIVPVHGLTTEFIFKLGRVSIRPLNSDFFDQWQQVIPQYPVEQQDSMRDRLLRFRKKFQGFASCLMLVEAEPIKAREIALEEAENVTALLRVLHPSIAHPLTPSYIRPIGKEYTPQEFVFIGDPQSNLPPVWHEKFAQPVDNWALNEVMLLTLERAGLGRLHDLYIQVKKTPFQQDVLKTLITYSRSSLRHDVADRLIYVFTALESFLLRSETESIQQNIAERIAFTIAEKSDDRVKIKKVVIAAYGLRSRAVHHNQSVQEIDMLVEFLSYVFSLFLALIHTHHKYKNREEFFEEIERKKFS